MEYICNLSVGKDFREGTHITSHESKEKIDKVNYSEFLNVWAKDTIEN